MSDQKGMRIYTEATCAEGGVWAFAPYSMSHVVFVEESDYLEALARAEKAEADLREARMQMLSDAGQAAEAYEAQLRAEAQCNAVMKDRAQIMRERDAALARVERGMKACDLFDGPVSKSQFVNGQATAAQQIRAALAGDAP